jgi:hypothetical protein
MTLDSAGRLGIGTTGPSGRLDVETASDTYINFSTSNNGSAAGICLLGNNNNEFFGYANNLRFATVTGKNAAGFNERMRMDSSGRLLIGTSSARALYGITAKFQVEGVDNTSSFSAIRNTNDAGGAYVLLGKSRGTTVNSSTIVQDGDILGAVYFAGADGSDVDTPAAGIECKVDGTPGANDMPGRLVFSTTADGASSPTPRMTIKNDGDVFIGTTSPQVNERLRVMFLRTTGLASTFFVC